MKFPVMTPMQAYLVCMTSVPGCSETELKDVKTYLVCAQNQVEELRRSSIALFCCESNKYQFTHVGAKCVCPPRRLSLMLVCVSLALCICLSLSQSVCESMSVCSQPSPNVFISIFMCVHVEIENCLLYTSPSPRDYAASRMPSSA